MSTGGPDALQQRILEATEQAPPSRLEAVEPDPQLLEQLRAEDAWQSQETVQASDYLVMLNERLWDMLGAGLVDAFDWEPVLKGLFWVVVVLVAGVLVAALFTGFTWLRARQRAALAHDAIQVHTEAAPPPAGDLRADLERLLGGAEPEAALSALWDWVAVRLHEAGRARWTPDITHRELVASVPRGWSGRPPLRRLARTVERLLFSGEGVEMASVTGLLPEAEAVVAQAEASP